MLISNWTWNAWKFNQAIKKLLHFFLHLTILSISSISVTLHDALWLLGSWPKVLNTLWAGYYFSHISSSAMRWYLTREHLSNEGHWMSSINLFFTSSSTEKNADYYGKTNALTLNYYSFSWVATRTICQKISLKLWYIGTLFLL